MHGQSCSAYYSYDYALVTGSEATSASSLPWPRTSRPRWIWRLGMVEVEKVETPTLIPNKKVEKVVKKVEKV